MLDSRHFHANATAAPPCLPPVPTAPPASAERHLLAERLETALAAVLLPSERHQALTDGLESSFAASQRERAESRTMLAVDGPFAVGKTAAVMSWAHELHRQSVGKAVPQSWPAWHPQADMEADHVPVAWVSLQGRQNALGIYRKILAFFRHGIRGTADELEIGVAEALRLHRTRLLVIDDAHMINTRQERGRDTLDSIKTLNDMLSQAGGTLLFIGADLAAGDLLNDPQIVGRLEVPHTLQPYAAGTRTEVAEWQRLVKACEGLIRPYLDSADEHPLLPHAKQLWDLSQGHVRDLTRLIAQGSARCLRSNRSALALDDFTGVRPLKRAADAQQRAPLRTKGVQRVG